MDENKLKKSKEEFIRIANDETFVFYNPPILIFLNKKDLGNEKINSEFIIQEFDLNEINIRKWKVCECSFYDNIGVYEGMNWILKNHRKI
jgi:hypothetical protein